ncbi:UDP-N-acetylenolpyruvoylglucosamine reductase [Sphaerochaeta pleomorpha str. Grapes]|uniref:UDP-N-acetylenolpyruvoylglucosamine reductase n=1 Tax=Sphaerochaeta pleomorpha (strain ATCC BAA-1885 / DSM 22778 / Grapes) TaxID=158190 RepID=G8QTK8_SPHPG|nr:UDP-N-acetylmuramate dehydrogenase [Sphaerochaeta pleomorpha]AEV27973.1 UDP-N-acetylenolpyruvoylglucosamine reductase [Sphaerochaeta pleomorpha str. Grapes]
MAINVRNSGEKINLEELLEYEVPLSDHTTIHTGGKADCAAHPSDFEELRSLLSYAEEQQMKVTVLGGGSNCLISDNGIEGLTIVTTHLTRLHISGELFCVRCGLSLDRAIDRSIEAGLSGLENLGGIPGTIGGAIFGNSGANNVQTSDLLYYVDYMTLDGKLHRMQTHADEFSYRKSPFSDHRDFIMYEAGFRLIPTIQTSDARLRKEEAKRKRKLDGQYDNPSLGCVFKNPPGHVAGKLIEECNLKGMQIGGAAISNRHGNIITNFNGKATSQNIFDLIAHIQAVVQKEQHITLEPEIQFIGRW